ncbi:MAG: DUF4340 domain-containing protein [Bacteroidetes bacterium]|nr:DUF4340 domain-containing protein [Bacteroidota bacterium]
MSTPRLHLSPPLVNHHPPIQKSVIPLLPMQKRTKIVLAVLLSTFAFLFLLWRNLNQTTAISHDLFALKSPNQINKITISPNNPKLPYLTLEKVDGKWIVRNEAYSYPADTNSVNQLLFWAMPKLQVKCPVPDAAKENVIKDITLNGTKVIFSTNDVEQHTVFVGYATPTQDATYMYFPGTERPCEITVPGFIGYLTPYFNTNIQLWRSVFLVDVNSQEITSLKVTYPSAPDQSFQITQKQNQWQLLNYQQQPIAANRSLIAGYLELSKTLAREAGEPAVINRNPQQCKEVTASPPVAIFEYTFSTQPKKTIYIYSMAVTEGETYSMETKDGTPKTVETTLFWAKSNDEPTLWTIQEIILRNRLKTLSNFLQP